MKIQGESLKSLSQASTQEREAKIQKQNTAALGQQTASMAGKLENKSALTPKFLDSAKNILQDTPEVDTAKVKEMRERIAKGEYGIKPDAIADKILRMSVLEKEVA